MTSDTLSLKLRQMRGAMSLDEAARRSGVAAKRIRMYEQGERTPYGKTLRRLSQAYGVPVRDLLEGTGETISPIPRGSTAGRRRRRRVSASGDSATQAVEIPVQINEGQTVRVVIELNIRQQPVMRTESTTPTVMPAARQPDQETSSWPPPGHRSDPDQTAQQKKEGGAPARKRRELRSDAHPLRRPLRSGHSSRSSSSSQTDSTAGSGKDSRTDKESGGKSDDALDVFREAYQEFRRKK